MAEYMKTYYLSLDMYQTSSDTFEVVEGDTANLIVLTLNDRGNPVDLTGKKVVVAFTRAGQPVQQDTDGNGVTISGEHHNIVNVDLYASSYANGNNTAEVQVWSGENYESLATSAWFNFKARRAKINDNTLLAVPTFPLLSGMLEKLANIARGVQAKWSTTDTTDPSYIQDKPVIGTDLQAATQQLAAAETTIADAAKIPTYDTAHKSITWEQVKSWLGSVFAPLAHKSRHASGGADALSPADIGAASLDSGIVTQSQARSKLISKTASFTLAAGDAEAIILVDSASAVVVTIPNDSTYNFPAGTTFSFIRWGSGTLGFAAASGVNWMALNGVASISVQGGSATLTKTPYANVWWLSCN